MTVHRSARTHGPVQGGHGRCTNTERGENPPPRHLVSEPPSRGSENDAEDVARAFPAGPACDVPQSDSLCTTDSTGRQPDASERAWEPSTRRRWVASSAAALIRPKRQAGLLLPRSRIAFKVKSDPVNTQHFAGVHGASGETGCAFLQANAPQAAGNSRHHCRRSRCVTASGFVRLRPPMQWRNGIESVCAVAVHRLA